MYYKTIIKQIYKYLLDTNFHITNEYANLNLLNAPFYTKTEMFKWIRAMNHWKYAMAVIETLDYALNYDEIISQYQIILSCFFPKLNKKWYHASQQRQIQLHLL